MKRIAAALVCLSGLGGCASLVHDAAESNAYQECRSIPNSADRIACERAVHERDVADRAASRPGSE